jgi:MFS family permease
MSVPTANTPSARIRGASARPGDAAKMRGAGTPKGSWVIVALLFLFMLVNFADKAVIGIAAVPMMQELRLSPREFGLIGSSFFLLFSLSAIVTGFIVNRMQTRWVLLIMGLVWALTQFPMLGTVGFATTVACRVALGAGEGPAFPVALHSAYKWFPDELRTLPTALIAQGAGVGIMVALPLLNWVIVRYSWPWAFGVMGITGLAWTAAWLVLGREGPLTASEATLMMREFRRPVGVIASALLAGCVSDQGARFHAGLDRPVGCAAGGRQRGPGNLGRLVLATPACPRGIEPDGARDLRRRLRRGRRCRADDHALCTGHFHQDRPDDNRGGAAFGHRRDRQCGR